jgi:phosphopantetheinyl transferase
VLDLVDPELKRVALAIDPTPDDLRRCSGRPPAEREGVLVRRGLVRLCVAAAAGVPVGEVVVRWTEKGAPFLAAPLAGIHLSWAQRQHQFACALARVPIGIDIEIADGGEIPWNALHLDEQAALRQAPPATREWLFLRIWAAKEAYAKALGEGLGREPAGFAVRGIEADEALIDDPDMPERLDVRIAFAPDRDRVGVVAVALASS